MMWRAKRRHAFSTIIHALRVRNLLASDCFDLGNLENKKIEFFFINLSLRTWWGWCCTG
jgi:hypothetical protein